MDLNNNYEGRRIASYSNLNSLKNNVLYESNIGGLKYLNNLDAALDFQATFYSQLIPTNQ